MSTAQTDRVLICLHSLALRPECGGVTDAQLLERFLARREDSAFQELVRRHGSMVLGVCRRVLGEPHDAEDAFQATFLVLVRQAAAIVPPSRVGPWLYGVARRTALKARSSAARRRRAEQEATRGRPVATPPPDLGGDLCPVLDEELGRLPEKYRAPLVLCLLEAKSRKEAAGLLGWSEGTLSGRLARAKDLLGKRLRRRGVVLAGMGLPSALAASAAAAAVPAALVAATVRSAASLAGPVVAKGVSNPVIALMEAVMKAMLLSKLKAVAAVLVLVVALGLGAAAVTWQCGPAAWGAAPAQAVAGGKSPAAPAKKERAKRPGYVIEPPDVLLVKYAPADGAGPVQIAGQHLVRPDGTIGLGPLGSVFVSGLTPQEARGAIAAHLAQRLAGFDLKSLAVEVAAINSRVYYVIVEGDDGTEQVYRFPATGNETILDAFGRMKASLLVKMSQKRLALHRVSANGKDSQVLPVDWKAITHEGNAATNYQLQPGDRLQIRNPAATKAKGASRTDAAKVGDSDAVQELEAITKALRAARSAEELQRVVKDLDVLTQKLRERLKKPGGAGRR